MPSLLGPKELLTSSRDKRGLWHAHYPTADQTLCGIPVPTPKRGRKGRPTCLPCRVTARVFHRIDRSAPEQWGFDRLAEAA